jgi:hypothetical protein
VNLRKGLEPQGRKRERADGALRRHSITPILYWKALVLTARRETLSAYAKNSKIFNFLIVNEM